MQDHSGGRGIPEANEQVTFPRFPVTVTQLPVTRCHICHQPVAYRPGTLTEALTKHYRQVCHTDRVHPEALELASR